MLQHYQSLGVESIQVNVHLASKDDELLDTVEAVTRCLGLPIASITVGDWQNLIKDVYARSRARFPGDWHVLADQDEFHVYPIPLQELEHYCKTSGYDYVTGCLLDRLALDGSLSPLNAADSVWRQYPIAAFLAPQVAASNPLKVVLVNDTVELVKGQHRAINGNACPMSEYFVPVHHFKWVGGILETLSRRAEILRSGGHPQFVESLRFVEYFATHGGRADLSDPRFFAANCGVDYPYWDVIACWIGLTAEMIALSNHLRYGPSPDTPFCSALHESISHLSQETQNYLQAVNRCRNATS